MNKIIVSVILLLGAALAACTGGGNSDVQTQKADAASCSQTDKMKSLISIVEIPATDFSRAVAFYQTILSLRIEEIEMGGTQMGVFPGGQETVNVVLVKGDDYKPVTEGVIIYLNGGDDLQPMLDKVEANGGKVVVPKTEISPEMGCFALFTDTEGNKLGLHSLR